MLYRRYDMEKSTNYNFNLPSSALGVDDEADINDISDNFRIIDEKMNHADGKGLSANDYTNEEKTKLQGIEANATHVIVDTELSGTSENAISNKVVYDKFENQNKKNKSLFANSVTGYKSGYNMAFDDISPFLENMSFEIDGAVLFKYPYSSTTKTENGITFTDNGDGTITVNGTATGLATFIFNQVTTTEGTSYVFGGCPSGGSIETYWLTMGMASCYGEEVIFTAPASSTVPLTFTVEAGTTCNNLVVSPYLYKNIENPENIKVYGKNLFNAQTAYSSTATIINKNNVRFSGEKNENVVIELPFDTYSISFIKTAFSSSSTVYIKNHTTSEGYATLDGDKNQATFTLRNAKYLEISSSDMVVLNNIQIELGQKVTDFEESKTAVSYSPNKGIYKAEPILPNMTVLSPYTVNCTYIRDTNSLVSDVKVNGESVVNNGTAELNIPKAQNNYELIETITLSEGVTTIERSQEADGTDYDFNKLYIEINRPTAAPSTLQYTITFNNGQIVNNATYNVTQSVTKYSRIMCENNNGLYSIKGISANYSVYFGAVYECTSHKIVNRSIYHFKIVSTDTIPAETVINIYGVRA